MTADEEEGEMFRTARAVLSRDELASLGREMASMKADARRHAARDGRATAK